MEKNDPDSLGRGVAGIPPNSGESAAMAEFSCSGSGGAPPASGLEPGPEYNGGRFELVAGEPPAAGLEPGPE